MAGLSNRKPGAPRYLRHQRILLDRFWRLLLRWNRQFRLARRAIYLVANPQFIAGDELPAFGAIKFQFSHKKALYGRGPGLIIKTENLSASDELASTYHRQPFLRQDCSNLV